MRGLSASRITAILRLWIKWGSWDCYQASQTWSVAHYLCNSWQLLYCLRGPSTYWTEDWLGFRVVLDMTNRKIWNQQPGTEPGFSKSQYVTVMSEWSHMKVRFIDCNVTWDLFTAEDCWLWIHYNRAQNIFL